MLALIRTILASHRDGTRRIYGDSLFECREVGCGLPIGNLTSQFFANIYLDGFDHFVKQTLRVKGYVRYVDDFLLFGPDRSTVRRWGKAAREFLRGLRGGTWTNNANNLQSSNRNNNDPTNENNNVGFRLARPPENMPVHTARSARVGKSSRGSAVSGTSPAS